MNFIIKFIVFKKTRKKSYQLILSKECKLNLNITLGISEKKKKKFQPPIMQTKIKEFQSSF